MLISYTKEDFSHVIQSLLPSGRAWSRNPDSIQSKLILSLGRSYERSSRKAIYLVQDVFPATSTETLPEWEASVGLPSICSGLASTLQERRAQVVSRLTSSGGQSAQYYIDFAKTLGKEISVKSHAPFRAGISRAGDHSGLEDWFFTRSITLPRYSITHFRAGKSVAGEAIRSWGDRAFECEIRQIIPSHTILLFSYIENS